MTRAFDAFHLPGIDAADPATLWAELAAGDVRLRHPILSARQMHTLAAGLRASRARVLERRPVRDIIRSIDAATRLLAEAGELRSLALDLLPHVTRMSPPMVELVLDRMAVDWRADALERLIAVEIGEPAALDGFVEEPGAGRLVRALGPRIALNVFAGNVPGVAVTALVRCLLVKAAVIGKSAVDDPVLPVLFARALQRVDPELAECVAITYWPGGRGEAEVAAIEEVDTIVVYGGAEAVRHVRESASADTRILEHGPRMSLGFVARGALRTETASELARDIARAAATFDQHGCVSLHGAFIERGGAVEPRELARLIFRELQALEDALPAGRLLAEEAANLHAERARVEFNAMERGGELLAGPESFATVAYSEGPDAMPSCLDRFVRVSAIDDLLPAIEALLPLAPMLQTAGLAAPAGIVTELAGALGRVGFTRVTSFAAMPWPLAHWHHDGASPLRELVRWVDLET
ncbi:MAG TPA: acyl-CoA reductase [Longimicrobiales bacterium]|nr:acyl-CoA reductase [Longimicrobiales bacterium]